MKYEFEYSELIEKVNSITIEVEDEAEEILDELCQKAPMFWHPDDIFDALRKLGVKVVEVCEGSEECHYEIL